jgi:hypothetical protein
MAESYVRDPGQTNFSTNSSLRFPLPFSMTVAVNRHAVRISDLLSDDNAIPMSQLHELDNLFLSALQSPRSPAFPSNPDDPY